MTEALLEKCRQAGLLLQEARKRNSQRLVKQALELYIQVIEAGEPDFVEPYLGLAYISFCAGQDHQAFGLLQRARELAPASLEVERMWLQMQMAAKTPFDPSQAQALTIRSVASLRALAAADEDDAPSFHADLDF